MFLEKHPPLSAKELDHLLDYANFVDDLQLRNRALSLADLCQELERMVRARKMHLDDVSGRELR